MNTDPSKPSLIMILFIILIMLVSAYAQDDFEKWKAEQQKSFSNYLSEQDREFSQYLKTQWKEFSSFNPMVPDKKPKPLIMPVAPLEEVFEKELAEPFSETPQTPDSTQRSGKSPDILTGEQLSSPASDQNREGESSLSRLEIQSFNITILLNTDTLQSLLIKGHPDNESISEFWQKISLLPLDNIFEQLNNSMNKLQLNDWMFAKLVNDVSTEIFPYSPVTSTLTTWYLLLKYGYEIKIGYNSSDVYLLSATDHYIYEVKYYVIESEKNFLLLLGDQPEPQNSLFIFTGYYPEAEKKLSLKLNSIPSIEGENIERTVKISFKGKDYIFKYPLNTRWHELLYSYPQTDFSVYFSAEMSHSARRAILSQLESTISGMEEKEAVDFILRFVQTGFNYKTDEINFGHEKYMFPEETLYYEFSDCEDRASLFIYLVKNLLDRKVIGLDYPGHISTAVLLEEKIEGSSIKYLDNTYYICDPSYYYARAGMCMPEYQDIVPKIIEVQ